MTKKDEFNVTFVLDEKIVTWIKEKVQKEDISQSQLGRKAFREMMAREKKNAR